MVWGCICCVVPHGLRGHPVPLLTSNVLIGVGSLLLVHVHSALLVVLTWRVCWFGVGLLLLGFVSRTHVQCFQQLQLPL